jgi:hypothetical protein
VHGAVCGGGHGEVFSGTIGGACVGQAQTAVAMGEGDLCGQVHPYRAGPRGQTQHPRGRVICAVRSILTEQAQEGKHNIHGGGISVRSGPSLQGRPQRANTTSTGEGDLCG